MAVVDDLGTWIEIGTITPNFNSWALFPDSMVHARTIRLIFSSTDWTKKGNTWLWLRHYFYNGNVTQSVRVYPKQSPTIIDLPIPEEMINAGLIVTELQTIKIGKFRLGVSPHVPYTVTAQYRSN